ncbi:MAG: hypothetical protein GX753_01070 [Erysipelothrix sp.]|nr:hypothetical protein [Erysipelothrix sp.]
MKKIIMLSFITILLVSCSKVTDTHEVIYDNDRALLQAQVDMVSHPINTIMADYLIDTTDEDALFNFASEVLQGSFLGVVDVYVDAVNMIHTVYDFKISNTYKGSSLKAGSIVQVSIPGGVMLHKDYENQVITLGAEHFLNTEKSESFIREKYDDKTANEIIVEINKPKKETDLVIQNFATNPEFGNEGAYLLFLSKDEHGNIYETVALNHGYKIVNQKEGTVVSVDFESDVTPEFKLRELVVLSHNN